MLRSAAVLFSCGASQSCAFVAYVVCDPQTELPDIEANAIPAWKSVE